MNYECVMSVRSLATGSSARLIEFKKFDWPPLERSYLERLLEVRSFDEVILPEVILRFENFY